jgi:hypothetical protein
MNIKADESRIGVEAVPCATCHVTLLEPSDNANADALLSMQGVFFCKT